MKNSLKDLREDHDLTQQMVADQIGITQRKYSYIETGIQQLTAELLVSLALLYNVSIDYLLCQTDNPKSLLIFKFYTQKTAAALATRTAVVRIL